MFATQRLELIKEILLRDKIVEVSKLADLLRVSDVTVRKDLDKLAEENFLAKIHGGAVLNENDQGRKKSEIENSSIKEMIAKAAIEEINPNDAIFVGPGSTCYMMHSFLKCMPDITVITNNIHLALAIYGHVKKVFLLGGEVRFVRGFHHNQPHDPEAILSGFVLNKAFMSSEGFDLLAGIVYSEILDSQFLKAVTKQCKQTHLLVDSSKFNKVDLYSIGDISSVTCVISDKCDDRRYSEALKERGTRLILA